MDALRSTFRDAVTSFGSSFMHALAAKSCPLSFILKDAVDHGLGIECASYGECEAALAAGCEPCKIVFYSPAKTHAELAWSLEKGLTINADNLDEVDRLAQLIAARPTLNRSTIGLRVNPIVEGGEIDMFAVSTPTSKFGHPLHTAASRQAAVDAFVKHSFLNAVHAHVGSAGTSMEMLAEGAAKLSQFADEVDEACGGARVTTIDIGGGLPANAESDETSPTWGEYAAALRAAAPALFAGGRLVVTEFGRSMVTKAGLVVAQVEYAKEPAPAAGEAPLRTAVCQVGADVLMRACYNPGHYQHRISVYDAGGMEIQGRRTVVHNIAGPLCFAGDYVRKGVVLPALLAGDLVVVRDCGSNTLSLFSRHCSRLAPPVWAHWREGGRVRVRREKGGERVEDVLRFWGGGRAPPSAGGGGRTCLVVVDVQPEYWSGLSDGGEMKRDFPLFEENTAALLRACRARGLEIAWVRADYRRERSPWLPQFSALNPEKGGETGGRGPPEWEPFAAPRPGEAVVRKHSWGVGGTRLVELLKGRGVEEVLVCGLITSVCVQQTAFGLFEAGFRTALVEDACADRGRRRHDAALELYAGYMYRAVKVEDVIKGEALS